MADFSTVQVKINAVNDAAGLQDTVRSVYQAGKRLQGLIARYQAGTDAPFVAAVNALYTQAQRAELSQMLTALNALVTDWETNHSGALV